MIGNIYEDGAKVGLLPDDCKKLLQSLVDNGNLKSWRMVDDVHYEAILSDDYDELISAIKSEQRIRQNGVRAAINGAPSRKGSKKAMQRRCK